MRHDAKLLEIQPAGRHVSFQIAAADSEARGSDTVNRTTPEPASVTQLLDIHEYERQRLGQELHDSAGQLLVALQLSVARLRILEETHQHDSLIDEIQDTVRQIDQEIRTLAFLDHPAELGDRSLFEAMRALVQGFSRRTGIHMSFECTRNGTPPCRSVSIAALRVAQEALVNIHRHSRASCGNVMLRADTDQLHLAISDNGVGIRSGSGGVRGIGLQGMRHRVEAHGGRFNVTSSKHGTKVSASMPLSGAEAGAAGPSQAWIS